MHHRSPSLGREARSIGWRPIVLAASFCTALALPGLPALAQTFSHLPTIDLYPTSTFATGNDEYGSPGGPDPLNNYGAPIGNIASPSAGNTAGTAVNGRFDLNAVISIPVARALAFQYEHDRAGGIDTTIGRVANFGVVNGHQVALPGYFYNPSQNDIVDTFRLSYTGIKGVGVTLGTFYRFRHNNQATADPGSALAPNLQPQDWHEQFLTLAYTTPPIRALNGFTLGASVDGEYNLHHVSGNPNVSPYAPENIGSGLYYAATLGYPDANGKPRFNDNYGVNANLPIDHGVALFGSATYGAFDFFDNNPIPFYYAIVDVGVVKKFSQLLSITADMNNLTQINNGSAPFVAPNAIHRVYLAIAADLHLAP